MGEEKKWENVTNVRKPKNKNGLKSEIQKGIIGAIALLAAMGVLGVGVQKLTQNTPDIRYVIEQAIDEYVEERQNGNSQGESYDPGKLLRQGAEDFGKDENGNPKEEVDYLKNEVKKLANEAGLPYAAVVAFLKGEIKNEMQKETIAVILGGAIEAREETTGGPKR